MQLILERICNPEFADKTVGILHEGDGKTCYLEITLHTRTGEDIALERTLFPNPKILSANLACDLGLYPARKLLRDHGVDPKSQLAHLNHSGMEG